MLFKNYKLIIKLLVLIKSKMFVITKLIKIKSYEANLNAQKINRSEEFIVEIYFKLKCFCFCTKVDYLRKG